MICTVVIHCSERFAIVKPHTTLADRVAQALIGPGDEAIKRDRDLAGDFPHPDQRVGASRATSPGRRALRMVSASVTRSLTTLPAGRISSISPAPCPQYS